MCWLNVEFLNVTPGGNDCFSILGSVFWLILLLQAGNMLWCSKTTLWHQIQGEHISRQVWSILLFSNMENSHYRHCHHHPRKKKVKCTLVQALRLCTGRTAHRGSRGIALLFLDHGNRRGEGTASRPGPYLSPVKNRYPLYRRLHKFIIWTKFELSS